MGIGWTALLIVIVGVSLVIAMGKNRASKKQQKQYEVVPAAVPLKRGSRRRLEKGKQQEEDDLPEPIRRAFSQAGQGLQSILNHYHHSE